MPWNLSIAQSTRPTSTKVVYKTDDDVSVHHAFETLVKTAFNNQQPSMSRLRRGISTISYNPLAPDNIETIPEITLKKLLRLRSQTANAQLDVQIGLRGRQLLISARKCVEDHVETRVPSDSSCRTKRGRSDDEVVSTALMAPNAKRQKPSDNPSIDPLDDPSDTPTNVTSMSSHEKARQIARELGMLRENLGNGKVVDTVLINVNKEEAPHAPKFGVQVPHVIMIVKLISGAALSLNKLQPICDRYGVEDGLFTSRTIRQANLSEIGTPTWRAAKAEGLMGATLMLNVR